MVIMLDDDDDDVMNISLASMLFQSIVSIVFIAFGYLIGLCAQCLLPPIQLQR